MKKIIFMGTPSYATQILKALMAENSFEIMALITQPDKPSGRGQMMTYPHIKNFIIENNIQIPIFQPDNLDEIYDDIKALSPDFIIVAAYGKLLKKNILALAPCINLHASILPQFRGASPIQSAFLEGKNITGVTSMLMNEGLDTGEMLGFSYVLIEEKDRVSSHFEKLSIRAGKLCVKTIKNFEQILPVVQNECDANGCKKIKKIDGKIDFDDASKIFNKFRAYEEWPGIYLDGSLKLIKLEISSVDGSHKMGEILKIEDKFIEIGCAKGSINVYSLQPPSKKQMDAKSYLFGKRLKIGDIIC